MRNATMTIKEMKKAYTKVFQNLENVDIDLVKELLENVEIKSANEDGKITSVATFEWLEKAKEALENVLAKVEPTETVETVEEVEEVTETESIDFENVEISLGKLATCVCGCGTTLPSGAMNKVKKADRGNQKYGFICPDCVDKVLNEGTENTSIVGSGDTWVFENEIDCINPSANIRACLMSANYIPTENTDLGENGVKFVSPTYNGFKSFHKTSETIQHLLDNGDILMDSDCYADICIGHVDWNLYCVGRYYDEIFQPLYDEMSENRVMAYSLFGCETFVSHSEKLKFTAKYVNRKQYDLCVKACKEMVSAIINNYLKNFTGNEQNDSHKAKIAGGKLVKLFNKFGKQALDLQEALELKEIMA